MSHTSTYDVAIVGYGPVGGATAANLLGGQMGLRVVVIERDPPDIYFRARAISIDEEVLRIWQQVGLADRLGADMQPGAGADFVDTNGVSIAKLLPADRGNGHPPPQQFIYQPAVEGGVLRRGVSRFPNVSLLLQHECLRLTQRSDSVELMLADLTHDEFKRIRASYVIAADGGSSAIRGATGGDRLHGSHLLRALDRDRYQGHRRMAGPRSAPLSLQPRTPNGRLPYPVGTPSLGVPGARRGERRRPPQRGRHLERAQPPGHYTSERSDHRLRVLQPSRPIRRPLAGRTSLPRR